MRDQRSDDVALSNVSRAAEAVLGMLFDDGPGLAVVDELVREYAGLTGDLKKASVAVQDGLSELLACGLVHRVDRFVFASRSAVGARRLIRG